MFSSFQAVGRLPKTLPTKNCQKVKVFSGNERVALKWQDPDFYDFNGFRVDTWEKTVVVRKEGAPPTGIEDGTVVGEFRRETPGPRVIFDESGLENHKSYYYKFFSFSKTGEPAAGEVVKKATPRTFQEYEVVIDKAQRNLPCSYGGVNKDWSAKDSRWIQTLFKDIYPVLMEKEKVIEKVDPSDYTYLESGAYINPEVQAGRDIMIRIPRIGVRITSQGSKVLINVTDDPISLNHSYYAFTSEENEWGENLYIGAFLGTEEQGTDGVTRFGSMFNKGISPLSIERMESGLSGGQGYSLLTFHAYTLLQALFVLYAKSVDSQQSIGAGLTRSSSPSLGRTGGTASKGFIYGTADGLEQVKFLGLEDLWGHKYCYLKDLKTDFNSFQYNVALPQGMSYFSLEPSSGNTLVGTIRDVVGNNEFGFLPKKGEPGIAYYPWPDNQAIFKGKPLTVGGDASSQNRGGIFYFRAEHAESREFCSRIQFVD